MGGATLGLIAWADHAYDRRDRSHDGPHGLRVRNVLFSLATRDEQRSVFSLDVLEDRIFLYCTAGSLAAILLGTELGFLQRILHTEHLDLHQWLLCLVVGLAIVPVSEGRRLLLERRRANAPADAERVEETKAAGA